MTPTKFKPPYNKKGTTFGAAKNQSGVYLICENGVLVYVGRSGTNLYKTLYRHFQSWTDKHYRGDKVAPPAYRVTYFTLMGIHTYSVRLVYCSPLQAIRLERCLIKKHNPRDNFQKYSQYELDNWDSRVVNQYEILAGPLEDCPF